LANYRYVRGAMVIAFGVLSHWFLDFVTHRPDMPLCPGGLKLGLGLWNSLPATVAVGAIMYALAIWLYLATTRPRDRTGSYAM